MDGCGSGKEHGGPIDQRRREYFGRSGDVIRPQFRPGSLHGLNFAISGRMEILTRIQIEDIIVNWGGQV